MLAVQAGNMLSGGLFYRFAIYPRDPATLYHIYLAPWIHGGWQHLFNNLFGFIIFSALCLLRGVRTYAIASFIIITVTGLLVWGFGRPAAHIGASGWIFGLWSLSVSLAWFQRRLVNLAIALFTLVFYGGMIWGVLPGNPGVSFESHLAGVISGFVAAWLTRRRF